MKLRVGILGGLLTTAALIVVTLAVSLIAPSILIFEYRVFGTSFFVYFLLTLTLVPLIIGYLFPDFSTSLLSGLGIAVINLKFVITYSSLTAIVYLVGVPFVQVFFSSVFGVLISRVVAYRAWKKENTRVKEAIHAAFSTWFFLR